MSDSLAYNRDIIKLKNPRDYPLWCVQVLNEFRTKGYENAIEPNFYEPTRQIAVTPLEDEGWDQDECEDTKLISDKLRNEKAIYKKAKQDSIGIIQSRIHCSRLSLLEDHVTA